MLHCILLAISVSIDALSLGVTYGIKHSRIRGISNLIIFTIALLSTSISIFLGSNIAKLFSTDVALILGSSLLIILGLYTIYKSFKENNNDFDLDNSNSIEKKEAFLLALAVSADASCVGLSCGIIGLDSFIYPILTAFFHTCFINCGNFIAYHIAEKIKISSKILSIISGIILISIGIIRLMF